MKSKEEITVKQINGLKSELKKLKARNEVLEQVYRLFGESKDIYFLIDEKFNLISLNKEGARFFKKIIGKNAINQPLKEVFSQFQSSENIINFIKRKDFKTPLELQYKNDYFQLYFHVIDKRFGAKMKKITDSKISSEKGQRLSEVIAVMPQVYYNVKIKNGETELVYLSPRIKQVFGFSLKEYVRVLINEKQFPKYVHPDDVKRIVKASKDALNNKKPHKYVYRFMHNTKKEYVWLEEVIYPKFDENGKHVANYGLIKDITEQVEAESALKKSEQDYKKLINDTSMGIILINKDEYLIFANKTARDIFKIKDFKTTSSSNIYTIASESQFLYKKYLSKLYKLYKEKKELLNKGREIPLLDLTLKDDNGRLVTLQTKISKISYNQEEVFQFTFRDITLKKKIEENEIKLRVEKEKNEALRTEIGERKKVEIALLESKNYANSIIDSSLDVIITTDNNGKIVEFNKAAQDIFGYKKKDIQGKDIKTLYYHSKERDKVYNKIQSNGGFAGEVINVKRNGQHLSSYLSASNIYDIKGKVVGSMGVSRDITKEKTANQTINQQAARLNAIIESTSHLIWSYKPGHGLTTFNKKFDHIIQKYYGDKPEINKSPIVKTETAGLNPLKEDQFWDKKYTEVLKGKKEHFFKKINLENQKEIHFEFFLNPIIEPDGKIYEISGIAHDITKQKQAESKLLQSLTEKEALLKEVHHRVKNNLQIISSIFNLQASYIKDPKLLSLIAESQNRIKSMALIHEILYQNENLADINFAQYIQILSKNLIYSYDAMNKTELKLNLIPIHLSLETAIPCGLIVNELITNSIKYAFPKEQKGKILINLEKYKNQYKLTVSDNGIGLPKSIDYKNSPSLGLQLVNALVEQINGEIVLNSTKGTTFVMNFKSLN